MDNGYWFVNTDMNKLLCNRLQYISNQAAHDNPFFKDVTHFVVILKERHI